MAISIREWVQTEWKRPKAPFASQPGDFWDASGLRPDATRRRLRRAPGWSAHVAWPAGFADPEGCFYDRTNEVVVFLGRKTANDHLASVYYDTATWSASSVNDLGIDVSTYGALQGYHQRNVLHWGGATWLITDNWDVYSGDYSAAPLTRVWQATGGRSARVLMAYADRLFFTDDQGKVYRLDGGGASFSAFYSNANDLDVRFMTAFHQYLALVGRTRDGALRVYRLPDVNPMILHEVTHLEGATGAEPYTTPFTDGCLFLAHRDRILFTSGWYADSGVLDLYAFDGHRIQRVAQLEDLPDLGDVRSAGLLAWRDEPLFWVVRTDTTGQEIRLLLADGSTDFLPLTAAHSSYSAVYSVGGYLVAVAKSGGDEGFYHTTGLSDGYVETSWLHFGSPGRLKRLNRLAVTLDGKASSFNVKLKYRVDGDTSWTQVANTGNAVRVAADLAGVSFYRLQVRVELDDDTGANKDYAIESISVVYSVDTGSRRSLGDRA